MDEVHHQPPSPTPIYQHHQHQQQQFDMDDRHSAPTPHRDVIHSTLSRDTQRPTSGCVTSRAPVNASTAALLSSPETGWRAISGYGGLWDRPVVATSVSSPADGEPADVSLVAASPTLSRTPLQTSDSATTGNDPLATLMRLYGTLSDDDHLPRPHVNHVMTSLPVMAEPSTPAPSSVSLNSGDYNMRELNEADDEEDDGPTKSYVCHVCQYIGQSRVSSY